jgi:hypothetical protein
MGDDRARLRDEVAVRLLSSMLGGDMAVIRGVSAPTIGRC